MILLNATPIFNPANNGFVYLGTADDGTLWVRSTAGRWSALPNPVDAAILADEFEHRVEVEQQEIINDNQSPVVTPPVVSDDEPVGEEGLPA